MNGAHSPLPYGRGSEYGRAPEPNRAREEAVPPELNRAREEAVPPEPNRARQEAAPTRSPGDGPLAYFITFHTHGTWLPGDERGSVDRHHNAPGTPFLAPDETRQKRAQARLPRAPVALNDAARVVVAGTLQEVASHSQWTIHALAVRTNHVHVVVSAPQAPERVMNAFKSWATRRLVEARLAPKGAPAWVRHGSTRYLWKPADLRAACDYVDFGQGGEL
jgi:REP element-mobilizing transposase RayT